MGRIAQSRLSLSAELRKQRSTLTNKGTLFEGTGIHFPSPGVVEVDGQLQGAGFDGDLDAGDAGTIGWAMNAERAAMPELLLRPGSIGNDALTDPVKQTVHKASGSNFPLTTTDTERAGVNITVPAGFTQAQASIFGRMYAINPNTTGGADAAGTDALYVSVGIDGNYSLATPTGISGSNGFATTNSFDSFILTGLTPGSTIRLSALASCAYQPIAASGDNFISAVASISWLR
jgi:hypothetical protein